tara:strand:+ start:4141 stop:7110 length:2970 start_codon:yes stop_codon:yes gene_type:complete
MSIKNFKFVSPGVFINEIDNSFIPKRSDTIGPVVIGRAQRGLAMQPIKVESYSDFVTMFGDTVPGGAGADVARDGNFQSPMYGTYAAKAFLNAGVAPLTYIRLLGCQDPSAATAGQAGWSTSKTVASTYTENGGAIGLWVFNSSSFSINPGSGHAPSTTVGGIASASLGTGQLAAIFYQDVSASMYLTGTVAGTGSNVPLDVFRNSIRHGMAVLSDTAGEFKMYISGGAGANETVTFGFNDANDRFMRKRFNTNPQLASTAGTFYPAAAHKGYWLGESYEQTLRDNGLIDTALIGVTFPIALSGSVTTTPGTMRQATVEAKTGWFIGQQLDGNTGSYDALNMQKLFRIHGRGHGEWLQRNCKISITNVRPSNSSVSPYGTFTVLVRNIADSDNTVQVMERFDMCTLDPTSEKYVARMIGDQYTEWDTTQRRLRTYGDYRSQSKFIRVEMNSDVDAGASDPYNVPYGVFGAPQYTTVTQATDMSNSTGSMAWSGSAVQNRFIVGPGYFGTPANATGSVFWGDDSVSVEYASVSESGLSGSLAFPSLRLRLSASDGGLSDPTNAYFGIQTTRASGSTTYDVSTPDYARILYSGYTAGGVSGSDAGVNGYSSIVSLDDVCEAGDGGYYWASGSRVAGDAVASYVTLLNAGYDSITAQLFGAFDGFDIKLPDPVYNAGFGTSPTELNSSPYYTIKRAIDTVADPEAVDMNLLTVPGLTQTGLTQHAINTCEARADSLALIDLPDVYIPPAEAYKATAKDRIGTTPQNAATALKDRLIDSSYGCAFYPWVQTRDETSGRLLWVPPSVAMMGVLASSERSSAVWFAPAGFNRGGLSDGAAGIPVTNVSERLTSKQRDTLYEARINPIASFPSSGIVVFGQKTLQQRQSALDRINVRRLVIYLKKQISILSTQVLFEQNVQSTWNRFTSLIEPLLANTKAQFGITDYRLILDETTTTPDLIDQNILYAKIMVKPARAIEYIAIDFVIMNTGASFDD